MPCILCYMQKTKENEQIKDDLHWFPAYVCSEHVLKNLANLSLIMIVHIKMILMEKSPCACMYRQNLANIVIIRYTDKIRNLPRGIDLQIWVQLVPNIFRMYFSRSRYFPLKLPLAFVDFASSLPYRLW